MSTVWVLTSDHNEYDQYGEYFLAVFAEKPTWQQLEEFDIPQNRWRHVLNGGGRKEWEYLWWHLKEITPIKGGNNV